MTARAEKTAGGRERPSAPPAGEPRSAAMTGGDAPRLSRTMSFFTVTMIGVGAMIGAGIFVLTGLAAEAAGPALILAFGLNGIITIFTAMAYAELGSAFPEAGGGYLWVKTALPQPSGFLSGWMSWFAHAVACSLYSLGFGAYFAWVLGELAPGLALALGGDWFPKVLAVTAVAVFMYVNYRGASETGLAGNVVTGLKIVILLLFGAFGIAAFLKNPSAITHFRPFTPHGLGGILSAMGLTFIAFEGYEIIAQSGEEVRDPKHNVPRAIFTSLLIVVPIYILVGFVALASVVPDVAGMPTWQYLGLQKELAMVQAARQFMPLGAIILLIGGIFSTLSALNATIYSSARVAFAMGRDHNLPGLFSEVDRRTHTPHWSILVSGVIIAAMAVSLPIEHVASAADIMFLLLFLLVNVSVINLRKHHPELDRGYVMPLFPYVPILGVATKLVLAVYMFNYSAIAWLVTAGWIGVGVAIYYLYSRRTEHAAKAAPILVKRKAEVTLRNKRVLVAVQRENEAAPLVGLACDLAGGDGEVEVVSVAEVPALVPLSGGLPMARRLERLLHTAEKVGRGKGNPVSGHIRVSHDVTRAILDSVEEVKPELLVLGWRPRTATAELLGTTVGPLVELAPCDVVVARGFSGLPVRSRRPLKVLIPTAGGPHAAEAVYLALRMKESRAVGITLASAVRPGAPEETRRALLERLRDTAESAWKRKVRAGRDRRTGQNAGVESGDWGEPPVTYTLMEGRSVQGAILAEARRYDLVMLGASNEGLLRNITLGSIPEAVARQCAKPVLVVRSHEGSVRTWLRRFLGTYRSAGVEIR